MRKLTIEEIKERLAHDDKVNPNIKIYFVTPYIQQSYLQGYSEKFKRFEKRHKKKLLFILSQTFSL